MACLTHHPLTLRFVRRLALVLAGSMLFTQLALAAYVCPGSPPAGRVSSDNDEGAMTHPCGDPLGATDSASPSLCAEHCKAAAQSDQVSTPASPVALFVTLYRIAPPALAAVPAQPAAATLSALFAATPPHAILHCVHRI